MACIDEKTRMKYFTENMNAIGIPWKHSQYLTIGAVLILAEQILSVADQLGPKTQMTELKVAGNLLDKVKVLKAMTFAGVLGAIVGSLAQAEYKYRTCGGSPILDLIDYAQRKRLYRSYLVNVWVAHPGIYNPDRKARKLTAGKLSVNHGKR